MVDTASDKTRIVKLRQFTIYHCFIVQAKHELWEKRTAYRKCLFLTTYLLGLFTEILCDNTITIYIRT